MNVEEGDPKDESRLVLGRLGEDAAVEALRAKGYRILKRNWDGGRGRNEIDIVAEDRGVVVFVEVKTRGPGALRTPEAAVDEQKRRRIRRAATSFLGRYRDPSPHRFDVISVRTDDTLRILSLEVIQGAFE